MIGLRWIATILFTWVLFLTVPAVIPAATRSEPLCDMVIQEEQIELEEFQLALRLARLDLAAYEQIFGLIEELWNNEATERMLYLEVKYDRDAARVGLDRADLIVVRQKALIERYKGACRRTGPEKSAGGGAHPAGTSGRRYQVAHCKSLGKAVEGAEIKLEFERELLASVMELRSANVATRQEVILAGLGVDKEQARLENHRHRLDACRSAMNDGDHPPD